MLWRRQFAKLGVLAALAFSLVSNTSAADDELKLALDDASQVSADNVTVRAVDYRDGRALEVRRVPLGETPAIDTFAFVPYADFRDGTIEVDVPGGVLPDAPPGARGFIGIVFRVETAGNVLPARVCTCVRRMDVPMIRSGETIPLSIFHSQAMTSPDYAMNPRESMSRTSIVPDEWTAMLVEVPGADAKLHVAGGFSSLGSQQD